MSSASTTSSAWCDQVSPLPGETDRGQGALADDHRVDELDRNVASVRARRRRGPEGDQPPAAREALGHRVAEPRDPIGLGGEKRPPADTRSSRSSSMRRSSRCRVASSDMLSERLR